MHHLEKLRHRGDSCASQFLADACHGYRYCQNGGPGRVTALPWALVSPSGEWVQAALLCGKVQNHERDLVGSVLMGGAQLRPWAISENTATLRATHLASLTCASPCPQTQGEMFQKTLLVASSSEKSFTRYSCMSKAGRQAGSGDLRLRAGSILTLWGAFLL